MFLHGYLADKRSFALQTGFFKRYFDVYALDFQGFGENSGMDKPYSLDDYIQQVKNFVEEKEIIRPSVVAHSFGARVAIKLAAQNPDFFDKIVLVGAAGLKPRKTFKKVFKQGLFKVVKPLLKGRTPSFFYSSDYLKLDPIMRESFKLIVNENLDDLLSNITSSVFIVYGKKDKETPLYMARKLHDGILQSKLLVIKDAGHFCFIDKPLKFNTEVKEFLLS